MHDAFLVRLASVDDIPVITRHRAEMFSDMGQLPSTLYADLVTKSVAYLREAIPAGEYIGWLASPSTEPRRIIAGAGVQRRRILPHPLTRTGELGIAHGRQAVVLNVFTEKDWRRKGLAALLMHHVLEWA